MEMTLSNKVLKQAGESTMNTLLEELGHDKEHVLSVRLDKGLGRALEEQASVWGMKNTSTAVRAILSFYFLPVVYQLEWKGKQVQDFKRALIQQKKEGISGEQMKVNYFLKALFEYMNFLEQTKQASTDTLKFAQSTEEELNNAIMEMREKIQQALAEMEQGKNEQK